MIHPYALWPLMVQRNCVAALALMWGAYGRSKNNVVSLDERKKNVS